MGFFFFKAVAAIVTADALDRHARSRSTGYWYPNQPGMPRSGSQMPYLTVGRAKSASGSGWQSGVESATHAPRPGSGRGDLEGVAVELEQVVVAAIRRHSERGRPRVEGRLKHVIGAATFRFPPPGSTV